MGIKGNFIGKEGTGLKFDACIFTRSGKALSVTANFLTNIDSVGMDIYLDANGTYDILHPDVKSMKARLEEAAVRGEWLIWDKQMHCFPLAWTYGLPEAKEGKNWILDLLRRI